MAGYAPSCLTVPPGSSVDSIGDIEYTVRISARAKRLQVRINPLCEVEVVLPQRLSARHVAPFVRRHRRWIAETRTRLLRERGLDGGAERMFPSSVNLRAIGACYAVRLRNGARPRLEVVADKAGAPGIEVAAPDERRACGSLQTWLSREARRCLPPWLEAVSAELGIGYEKVSIRAQKTRWGSCSSRGVISLNRALLFLDPELVRYLMIHELCHRIHMNHSPAYWRLVSRFAPRYKDCERRLTQAARSIPPWSLVRAT